MEAPPEPKFNCTVCGAEFGASPFVRRLVSGGRGKHEGLNEKASLCWVCLRLKCSVDQEIAQITMNYASE